MLYKKIVVLLLLGICLRIGPIQAQDFTGVDSNARHLSKKNFPDVVSLTEALSEGCVTEREKVRAFYVWVTDNIRYDVKALERKKGQTLSQRLAKQTPERVLKSKRAVCSGYANLFIALCHCAGVEAVKVTGITKNHKGKLAKEPHAWCAVRADSIWGLVDPTWGAGYVIPKEERFKKKFDGTYFYPAPNAMILHHFPDDPIFQLSSAPINFKTFKNTSPKKTAPSKVIAAPGFSHIPDSLNAFVSLDSFQALKSIGERALAVDPTSSFGLYHLGSFYYTLACRELESLLAAASRTEANKASNKGVASIKTVEKLHAAKQHLEQSMSVFKRKKQQDRYAKAIKAFQRGGKKGIKRINRSLRRLEMPEKQRLRREPSK